MVDDASTDGTPALLRTSFAQWIETGSLVLTVLPRNGGVTAAKNAGAREAQGDWLIFLDSDDELLAESIEQIAAACREADEHGAPLLFARCVARSTRRLIGEAPLEPSWIGLREYLNCWRWGECLPLARRDEFLKHPYDADLRGFEGLAYARILRDRGRALITGFTARTYEDSATDRLSHGAAIARRSCLLALGHWRLLRGFAWHLKARGSSALLAKIVAYCVLCGGSRLYRGQGAPRTARSNSQV